MRSHAKTQRRKDAKGEKKRGRLPVTPKLSVVVPVVVIALLERLQGLVEPVARRDPEHIQQSFAGRFQFHHVSLDHGLQA